MSQYETDVIKLLTRILDELQRIRISLEDRDRMQQKENENFLRELKRRIVAQLPSKLPSALWS